MDKISEILNSIKERLSNPLIFSFIISWLICNWRITVALLWFDEKQIEANGCSSIFEFITDEWKRNGYFWIPFFIALGYTFGFPIFKNLVSASQTWTAKWGDNWNLSISKDGKVPIGKYLSLRQEYKIKIQELEEIIENESRIKEDNLHLNEQIQIYKNQINEKDTQLIEKDQKLVSVSNYRQLNGYWRLTYEYLSFIEGKNKRIRKEYQVFIKDFEYYIVEDGIKKLKFRVNEFYFDPSNKSLILIMEYDRDYLKNKEEIDTYITITTLKVESQNWGYLKGKEDHINVEYRKI